MKALTLVQPWATLIALGIKRYETRSWGTSYRGPLAIHAGVQMDRGATLFAKDIVTEPLVQKGFMTEPERRLASLEWVDKGRIPKSLADRFPRGVVLGVVDLVDCIRTGQANSGSFQEVEHWCGDLSPGRFAWKLINWRAVVPPRAAKGKLGLWDIEGLEVNGDKAI